MNELIIIWVSFQIIKASNNALQHDYKHWKQRFGIPDKWDYWFNPAISWKNKYESKIWLWLTPFSDIWHTLWTLWQINVFRVLCEQYGWIGFIWGVAGVFIIFNGLYNFLRYKKFIG